MIVTIDTLNALGLEVAADKQEIITNLVANHEREYFNLTLSPELSAVFTDTTKDDARFLALRNTSIIKVGKQSINTRGLDYGVNNYIYFKYLQYQFDSITSAGQTVAAPKNSLKVDPRAYTNHLYYQALRSSDQAIYQIETDKEDTYSEYTNALGLAERSGFNY